MSGIGGLGAVDPYATDESNGDAGFGGEAEPEAEAAVAQRQSSGGALSVWQALQQDTQAALLAEDLTFAEEPAAAAPAAEETDVLLQELDVVDQEASALAEQLSELTSQLAETGSASGVSGMSLEEIQDRIAWIESELAFLYEYKDLLIEELSSPDTGWWESVWVEWDLWDVEFCIEDLEAELAGLEGEAYDASFDELWESYWHGFGESVDAIVGFMHAAQSDDLDYRTTDDHAEARRLLLDAAESRRVQQEGELAEQREGARRALAEGLPPTLAPDVRDQLRELRPLVDSLRTEPSAERLDALREAIAEIRGPRAHHDQVSASAS